MQTFLFLSSDSWFHVDNNIISSFSRWPTQLSGDPSWWCSNTVDNGPTYNRSGDQSLSASWVGVFKATGGTGTGFPILGLIGGLNFGKSGGFTGSWVLVNWVLFYFIFIFSIYDREGEVNIYYRFYQFFSTAFSTQLLGMWGQAKWPCSFCRKFLKSKLIYILDK